MPGLSFEAKIGMVLVIVLMVVTIFVYHVLLERFQRRVSRARASAPPAKSAATRK